MCFTWVPDAVEYIEFSCRVLEGKSTLIYLCFAAVILPVFCVFVMAFKFVPAFSRDSMFDKRIAKLIIRIAIIILLDCIFFGTLACVVLLLGERVLSPLLLLIALMGITVSVMLMVLGDHVEKAAVMKEEAEGTI